MNPSKHSTMVRFSHMEFPFLGNHLHHSAMIAYRPLMAGLVDHAALRAVGWGRGGAGLSD
jgi:hypothetical protein